MSNKFKANASAGFTLIEIMIALAISGLVMMVLIEVFSSQQQMYYRQTALTKAQANARASLAVLSREIRMAGYTGLPLGISHINSNAVGSGPNSIYTIMSLTNDGNPISGGTTDLAKSSMVIADKVSKVSDKWDSGSGITAPPPDSFEILGNFSRGITGLKSSLVAGSTVTTIKIPSTGLELFGSGFNRPAFVVIGNNDRAEIFRFKTAPEPAEGSSADVTITIEPTGAKSDFKANDVVGGAGNVVLPIYRRVYFIDTYNVTDINGNITGTLMVANYDWNGVISGSTVELVRDVMNFQVSYDYQNNMAQNETVEITKDPCLVNSVRLAITNKGWEPKNVSDEIKKAQQLNRDLLSVVRIRNSGLGQASCPTLP